MAKKGKSPLDAITVQAISMYLRRHTYLTVAIVSWVAMGLLTLFVVVPQVQTIAQRRSDLAVEQAKLTDLTTRVQFLQSLSGSELTDQRDMFQKILPSEKPVTPLISSMEKLAGDAGVTLKSFELTPGSIATQTSTLSLTNSAPAKVVVAGVGALPLKLEVSGGFAQMNTFFKSMDQLVPLINVNTIDFTSLSDNGTATDSAVYKASVGLDSLYELPGPTAKADTTSPLAAFTAQDKKTIADLTTMVNNQPQLGEGIFPGSGSAATDSGRLSIFSY